MTLIRGLKPRLLTYSKYKCASVPCQLWKCDGIFILFQWIDIMPSVDLFSELIASKSNQPQP